MSSIRILFRKMELNTKMFKMVASGEWDPGMRKDRVGNFVYGYIFNSPLKKCKCKKNRNYI